MHALLLVSAAAAAAFVLTLRVRAYSLRTRLLDVPGERSSHSLPTPRGGGAAFVPVILLCGIYLYYSGAIPLPLLAALLGGGGAVACIGWLDDRRGLSARLRFAVHCLAALWALLWVGAPGGLFPGAGYAFFFLAIVWILNLYNFMDGIDGIAAGEAVVVGFCGAVLCGGTAGALCLPVAGASLGFLYWNWPRAKIFMGDVGSGFLGFVFALAWVADAGAPHVSGGFFGGGFFTLPVLLGCFLVDATLTLAWRVFRGEKWWAAHRLHVYQTYAAAYGHRAVTLAYMAITAFWLAPMAWAARECGDSVFSALCAAIAYAPLAGYTVYVHARKTAFEKK